MSESQEMAEQIGVDADSVQIIGDGEYYTRCPTCERIGHAPDGDSDPVLYFTDEKYKAKMEARDHREWHPDHRPVARSISGEKIYG